MPGLEWLNTPVVVRPSARQFAPFTSVGPGVVAQQVPRALKVAGRPAEVTFAPSVALEAPTAVCVGEVTVGTIRVVNVPSGVV